MPAQRSRIVPVLLAAALLVGAANLGAYAATGGPLLLGKSNTATKTTKLKTTGNGPALKLKSKAGKAPFAVSNSTTIKKLNADLVDGHDGAALQTKSYYYNLSGTATDNLLRFALPGLPAGRYIASYSVSADVAGFSSFFGCVFDSGAPFANARMPAIGASPGSGWFVTGAGLLDTTSAAYTLTCQTDSGSGFVVPSPPAPAEIVLTRVDEVAASSSSGVPATSMRPGLRG